MFVYVYNIIIITSLSVFLVAFDTHTLHVCPKVSSARRKVREHFIFAFREVSKFKYKKNLTRDCCWSGWFCFLAARQ